MPKIISGIKEKIIAQAEELIYAGDYTAFTARNLAKNCGIAVGTLYNYFPSMEDLMIFIIWNNWGRCFDNIDEDISNAETMTDGICILCTKIREFAKSHLSFWTSSITAGFSFSKCPEWRDSLRRWLSQKIELAAVSHNIEFDPKYFLPFAEIIMALGANCDLDIDIVLSMLMQPCAHLETQGFRMK